MAKKESRGRSGGYEALRTAIKAGVPANLYIFYGEERYLLQNMVQQLKELLEHMDGVGKTRVMLTFSDEGTDQLDKNVTKDGNKKEETTVVYDTGDTRQPYVICRQMPKIEGVVVVAQGGGNAKTVTEISNAVMSLFPVEAHKVVVVKMSVQEE